MLFIMVVMEVGLGVDKGLLDKEKCKKAYIIVIIYELYTSSFKLDMKIC